MKIMKINKFWFTIVVFNKSKSRLCQIFKSGILKRTVVKDVGLQTHKSFWTK